MHTHESQSQGFYDNKSWNFHLNLLFSNTFFSWCWSDTFLFARLSLVDRTLVKSLTSCYCNRQCFVDFFIHTRLKVVTCTHEVITWTLNVCKESLNVECRLNLVHGLCKAYILEVDLFAPMHSFTNSSHFYTFLFFHVMFMWRLSQIGSTLFVVTSLEMEIQSITFCSDLNLDWNWCQHQIDEPNMCLFEMPWI